MILAVPYLPFQFFLPNTSHEHNQTKRLKKKIVRTPGSRTLHQRSDNAGVKEYQYWMKDKESGSRAKLKHVIVDEDLCNNDEAKTANVPSTVLVLTSPNPRTCKV